MSIKIRCAWASKEIFHKYHDSEWCVPNHNDRYHFEILTLEGAQAGLSWETVLKKRKNYKKLFDNFDVKKVSKYNKTKIEKLLKDEGIIRNRLKVESTVQNAKEFIKIQKEFGSFDKYIWNFVDDKVITNKIKSMKDVPSQTSLSDLISKDLKSRGFKFVGSTIIYAYLQAVGIVNDHEEKCFCKHKK